ncbi:MAG: ABC transporter ATP-binding protein [Candidatus Rokubacteria bacterium]|nr:ABC transporter ATP-binding protein [Candidatus Rokubacteria bacterium]
MLLEVDGLQSGYGKKRVLDGVSLHVAEGEIVALLGHNGAGKSTTLKTILGLIPARAGQVRFAGQPWTNGNAAANVERGIALVPEGRGVFPDLTVAENLRLGAYALRDRDAGTQRLDEVFELFPILAERQRQIVGTLSGGQQQMVAVGIALMPHPKLMMMDEPSIGLAPVVVQRVLETVRHINQRFGTAIVLVEQNIKTALGIASRAYVMKSGRIVLERPAAELLAAQDSWWELY